MPCYSCHYNCTVTVYTSALCYNYIMPVNDANNLRVAKVTCLQGIHLTPASSWWSQLCDLVWLHCSSVVSDPLHDTSSIRIGPHPWPKKAPLSATESIIVNIMKDKKCPTSSCCKCKNCIQVDEYPNFPHTTLAAWLFQPSSHTVPHFPDMNTCTVPFHKCRRLINLISPSSVPSVCMEEDLYPK